jgi:multidrug efflux pump subunit AcrB
VNDISFDGQVNRAIIQADWPYRKNSDAFDKIYVKSNTGAMVPLQSLVKVSTTLAPRVVECYNKFTSASITTAMPFISSSDAMAKVTEIAKQTLPEGYTFDWSSLSYQESQATGSTIILFFIAMVFGYLFLVAQNAVRLYKAMGGGWKAMK